jgi:hypothetical protein
MHSIDQPDRYDERECDMPTMTPKEVAAKFDTSPKRLRKFLRSETAIDDRPGKGGRWALDLNAKSLAAMKKRFDAWATEQAKRNADRLAALAKGDEVEDEVEEGDDA